MMNSTQELFALLTISLKNRESWLAILESALYLTVILTAFLGNSLFILAFSNTPSLRSPQNFYLVSLAIADILNAVVCMPVTLAVSIKGKWDFSDVICQLQGSLISVFSTVSLLTLCMIAINRYVKITRSAPLYRRLFSKGNVLCSIALSWIVTVFLNYSAYFVSKTVHYFHPGKCLCFVTIYLKDKLGIYSAILYSIVVSVSFNPIVFSYYKVLRKIRAHFVQVRSSSFRDDDSTVAFAGEAKITTMLFATILAFFICWTPSVIIDFYEVIAGYYKLPRQVYMLNIFTYVSSSAINPIIYGFMRREFKEGYKRALCFKS